MRLLGIGPRIEILNPSEAYEFSLPSIDGSSIEFKKEGKIVFLTFFSLDCPACMQEIGILNGMKGKISENFSILAINVDGMGSIERLKKFVNEENIWFKICIDRDGSITRRYGVYSLPTSFLIDKNFMIRFRFLGPILNDEDLFKKVKEIE
jgi:peroxiredoxin